MAQVNYIRYLSSVEGKKYTEIANQLGIDWRTVKKYAKKEDLSPKIRSREREAPVMDPVKPIIEKWLREDQRVPRKQRHTAKRIYQRLCKEHGFQGSYSSVRKYIGRRKREIRKEVDAAIPLRHPGGEAQVDFGELTVIYQGSRRKAHHLVLSFPFSNAGFVQLFWGENQECLIEGLVRIFEEIGSVPRKIWFDNLTAAVTRVGKDGSRCFTEGFRRFAAHYRFLPVFCNPSQANEKGNVENKVGYIRRNWFVPLPMIEDLERFNRKLLEKSWEDLERKHYERNVTIKELFKRERTKLMRLPLFSYDNFRLVKLRANKYGYVRFDKNLYTTSPNQAGKWVWAKLKYDAVEILNKDYKKIVTHPRLYGKGVKSEDWLPYLEAMIRKPRAIEYTDFYQSLPEPWKTYIKGSEHPGEALQELYGFLQAGLSPEDTVELLKLEDLYNKNSMDDYPMLPEYSEDPGEYDSLLRGK